MLQLPLLAEEVRGSDALRSFSEMLVLTPEERRARVAQEADAAGASADRELTRLREENASLRAALAARGGAA